jgi:Domain of unknown function (DUF4760)
MWSGIKGILDVTWKYSKPFDRVLQVTILVLVIVVAILAVRQDPIFVNSKAAWCIVGMIIYAAAIIPPVKRMTDRRHELLFYVTAWGILSLILILVAFYTVYFIVVPDSESQQWDRILNLPPVFAAVFGTAIGWYVHQQLSAKLHRTSNSFALVMQTRTSTEFLKHTRSLYAAYPPPTEFQTEDAKYFETSKRIEIDRIGRELAVALNPDLTKKGAYLRDLAKVEAVEGLRYLLNFYEFMAFGIHAGDLDETLLYETVSPSVVGWYTRSQTYCDKIRATAANKLAYQHLHRLVEGYKTKVGNKEEEIDGWKKRLDIEKANSTL